MNPDLSPHIWDDAAFIHSIHTPYYYYDSIVNIYIYLNL